MRRREFLSSVGGVTAASIAGRFAYAQQRKIPLVGVLWHAGSEEEEAPFLVPFRNVLRDLGYVEGQTVAFEHRFPGERPALFESMALDLVRRKVDVLVAVSPLSAAAAKRATASIPIIFVIHPNPVESGLVSSLARPDGNITGFSNLANDLSAKQLELLKEALPGLSRIGVVVNSTYPVTQRFISQFREAADRLNLKMSVVEAKAPMDLEQSFSRLAQEGADGVAFGPDSMYFNERATIGQLAAAHRLPVIALNEVMVRSGMLLYYGPHFGGFFRGAAGYVDRILKGAKPSELPVQLPTKFELAINLKTARVLGVTMPATLLARADEVIE